MRLRLGTVLALMGLAALFLAGGAGPALAQGYTTQPPVLGVSDTNPAPGQEITVEGGGFAPGSQVTIVLGNEVLRTVTTDAAGNFRTTVVIPEDFPCGPATLEARGTDPGGAARVLSANLNIECPAGAAGARRGAAGAGLPRTGSTSAAPLTAAGVGLVLIGAAAVIAARRRRSAEAPSS